VINQSFYVIHDSTGEILEISDHQIVTSRYGLQLLLFFRFITASTPKKRAEDL
jgi:hypothetical protein